MQLEETHGSALGFKHYLGTYTCCSSSPADEHNLLSVLIINRPVAHFVYRNLYNQSTNVQARYLGIGKAYRTSHRHGGKLMTS